MVLLHKLVNENGGTAAGRALEIPEFFQRDRSVWVTANMNRFGRAFARHCFVCRNSQEMRTFCLVEQRSAPERGQCDRTNNDKRQIAFHKTTRAREASAHWEIRQT